MWTLADFDKTRWVERKLNAIFMSKHGDDRNDGHPRRPVASLSRAAELAEAGFAVNNEISFGDPVAPIVVSSGVYSDSANLANVRLIGDGFVTFDGVGAPSFDLGGGYSNPIQMRKLRVQNYGLLSRGGNFSVNLAECILVNIGGISDNPFRGVTITARLSLLVDCFSSNTEHASLNYLFDNCTLIGTRVAWGWRVGTHFVVSYSSRIIRNCYLDSRSPITFLRQEQRFSVLYSNIQGTVSYDYNPSYPAVEPVTSLADFRLENPARIVNCLSTAPGFNNPVAMDFTLAATSAMLNLAFDGGFSGAYGIGINFSGLADADQVSNAQWNSQLQAFVLTNPNVKGVIEFVVKDFTRNWILNETLLVGSEDSIDRQTIDSTISYDTDAFGEPANVQSGALETGRTFWNSGYSQVLYKGQSYANGQFFAVTDDLTYTVVGSGKVIKLVEAPNIRLFEMKYSTVSAVDCASRPWSYFVFNRAPQVDAAGRSNGDPSFNPATANPVTVRYVKLRLTLMPNSLA